MRFISTITIILMVVGLSIFSTGVLSYISMATPIGPWVAPMLVLIASILFKTVFFFVRPQSRAIALSTAGGSVGGILATACGFSFPTLYFLDKSTFSLWLSEPMYFAGAMSLLAISAGGLGFLIANTLEKKFIIDQKLAFPIGQLVYKMIAAQNQLRKSIELMVGFVSTAIFCALQGGVRGLQGVIPTAYTLMNASAASVFRFPAIQIRFDLLPMLWAIGFIAGHIIAIPLAVGTLSKIFVMDPIRAIWFWHIGSYDFVLAFASGMVVVGAVMSFLSTPKMLVHAFKQMNYYNLKNNNQEWLKQLRSALSITEIIGVAAALIAFFIYFNFSIIQSLYLVIFTYVCTYQITLIAGKIGLAQLGRFATFVMVPAMFLFGVNPIHLTLIATFVEICAGVATDILFGRKMANMAHIEHNSIKNVQLLGLIVSSLSIGVIFYLLINHFGLGGVELVAQRAQARALLINVRSFNIYALLLGAIFGYILKRLRLNPMLVLGGLIMPINVSIGLVAGGLSTYLVKDREEWEPFWSGVFAANSVWELLKTVI